MDSKGLERSQTPASERPPVLRRSAASPRSARRGRLPSATNAAGDRLAAGCFAARSKGVRAQRAPADGALGFPRRHAGGRRRRVQPNLAGDAGARRACSPATPAPPAPRDHRSGDPDTRAPPSRSGSCLRRRRLRRPRRWRRSGALKERGRRLREGREGVPRHRHHDHSASLRDEEEGSPLRPRSRNRDREERAQQGARERDPCASKCSSRRTAARARSPRPRPTRCTASRRSTKSAPAPKRRPSRSRSGLKTAIRLYKRVIDEFPKYRELAGIYYFLGHALNDSGRAPEAQQVWRSLVCHNHLRRIRRRPIRRIRQGHRHRRCRRTPTRRTGRRGVTSTTNPKSRSRKQPGDRSTTDPYPNDCTFVAAAGASSGRRAEVRRRGLVADRQLGVRSARLRERRDEGRSRRGVGLQPRGERVLARR